MITNVYIQEELVCAFCKKICKNKHSYSTHIRRCRSNPNQLKHVKAKLKECDKCHKHISSIAFNRHYNSCTGKIYEKLPIPDDLKCVFCGKIGKNKNSYRSHYRSCQNNPNRKAVNNQFTKAKSLDLPIPQVSNETKKKILETKIKNNTLKHTDESKQNISKARKEYLLKNPDKVPYKLNHYSKGPSYPEIYWKTILDSNNCSYDEQYQINLYSLDFAILDLKIDIEIDGDQHYLDDRIVESDKKRTLYLESNGWKVLRIKWSDYQKLNFEEKEIFVKDFIAMIKSPE